MQGLYILLDLVLSARVKVFKNLKLPSNEMISEKVNFIL